MLGYPMCYMDVMEGSRAMSGCQVGYIDVTGRAGVPGEEHGPHGEV
jgi:hypothetical protein